MSELVLAGDIGGTKVSVACFSPGHAGFVRVKENTYRTAHFSSLEEILAEFLNGDAGRIRAACFGAAGPVENGFCRPVNYPWVINQQSLQNFLQNERVGLINDLVAMAYGIEVLSEESFGVLNTGQPVEGAARVLIAAGTGLGQAQIFRVGGQWHPFASEGGHVDFAPTSPIEAELLDYLTAHLGGRVSYERILSGPGLHNIYQFLRDKGHADEQAVHAERMAEEDPGAVITELALSGRCPLCQQALELFARIYGAEAGNLALKAMGTGGVYLGGGIAPRILPLLQSGAFMSGFTNKGRLVAMMQAIPVRVILNPATALLGAAHCARQLSQEG